MWLQHHRPRPLPPNSREFGHVTALTGSLFARLLTPRYFGWLTRQLLSRHRSRSSVPLYEAGAYADIVVSFLQSDYNDDLTSCVLSACPLFWLCRPRPTPSSRSVELSIRITSVVTPRRCCRRQRPLAWAYPLVARAQLYNCDQLIIAASSSQ